MKLNQPCIRWGALALVGSVVTLLAFTGGPKQTPAIANHNTDTIPTQKRNKITREDANDRDLDKELHQLDDAKEKLEQMKDKDWDAISKQVEESISKIDFDKIQQQVDEAVKRIDVEKIHRQVEESLRKIDFDKIQQDLDQSFEDVKRINKEDVKREIENARKEVDNALRNEEWKEELKETQRHSKEDVQKELDNAKKEMARVKEEMKNQKFNFQKDMDKAREEVGKAAAEMKGYQEMIYEMEKDGLLNTKEDYSIEYRSGDLFINDKKQPQSVTDKYNKYLKKKNIAIKKQDGKMKINHQER
jgi:chromosome segregation ATPase